MWLRALSLSTRGLSLSSPELVDQGLIPELAGSGREADVGSKLVVSEDLTLEVVLAADAWARRRATELIETGHRR